MVVGFNFLIMSVYSFQEILNCFFVDQISQIVDLIKKDLSVADDKIWECLKTVITIHNYSTMILFASDICFSVNSNTNMVL
jgi:flagellar biosynthesis regulator FlbT